MFEEIHTSCVNVGDSQIFEESLFERFGMREGFFYVQSAVLDGRLRKFVCLNPVHKIIVSESDVGQLAPSSSIAHAHPLRALFDEWNCGTPCALQLPLIGGMFSYEYGTLGLGLEHPNEDLFKLPLSALYFYSLIIEIDDRSPASALFHQVTWKSWKTPYWESVSLHPLHFEALRKKETPSVSVPSSTLQELLEPYSQSTHSRYIDAVSKIIELIRAGDVYQVNLSQRFQFPGLHNPPKLFLLMRELNSPRYASYLTGIDSTQKPFSVLSASPELFIASQNGSLLSSPIKGTRPRGATPSEDVSLKDDLRFSKKDHAELSMIVDLIRNDMGKCADIGSVTVAEHARLESLPHVHHLVSDVTASLRADADFLDVFHAMFPCGSITGAPKRAAMGIISALEGECRGIYTGALGFISNPRTFEFNVAIRTALVRDGVLHFQAGGGIVVDSIPEDEYWETLFKARSILAALQHTKQNLL